MDLARLPRARSAALPRCPRRPARIRREARTAVVGDLTVSSLTAAIAGLGLTDVGKVYGRSAGQFATDAVRRAAADAGLALADMGGLRVMAGLGEGVGGA